MLEIVCVVLDLTSLVVERKCRMAVEELHKLVPEGYPGALRLA